MKRSTVGHGQPETRVARQELASQHRSNLGLVRTGKLKLTFNIPMHTEFGQDVAIVGAQEELGSWDVNKAPSMEWTSGDVWKVDIFVDHRSDVQLQYKYVVRESNGEIAQWKPGSDVFVKLPDILQGQREAQSLNIRDQWDGSCQEIEVELAGSNSTLGFGRQLKTISRGSKRNSLRIGQSSSLQPGADSLDKSKAKGQDEEETLAEWMSRASDPLNWSYEQEKEMYMEAVDRAFQDLNRALSSSLEMRTDNAFEPDALEMVEADRAISAAAQRATAALRVRDATSPPEALSTIDQAHPYPLNDSQRRGRRPTPSSSGTRSYE